ncbi:HNH endonuclease [Streptomyces torulosus]|uniref:HNH endonuclease n=1 Tax=Streptomyces torulosus TaxID=68276 RepID=UPI00099E67BA|nr:HNH endonuclease signature motif containing protein [Streptomyces torulosus]
MEAIRRGDRGKQKAWVWLMVLTAQRGLCVYCGRSPSTTLDHERPIAGAGHDIWWNFVPACKPCNLRKSKHESAAHWVADMDICHRYPELTRSKWRMSPKVFAGITRRVERVQREIADADRREWFELHYGEEKWGNKTELFKILDRCKAELKGYPHYPWRTPKVRELMGHCTRLICCGYFHPQARLLHAFLDREEVRAFQRAVFNERAHEGEVLGRLVREYLADRQRDLDDEA